MSSSDKIEGQRASKNPSDRKLSEVASVLCYPEGIKTTLWPEVERRAADMDLTFDRWQAGIGTLALGKNEDGEFVTSSGAVVLSIPRQVGKTYLIGWLVFILAIIFPGITVIWTAHRTRTADETFQSMKAMAMKAKVRPFIADIRSSNGQAGIKFFNGSRILFGARESGFGRGFTKVNIVVLDEAQILSENALDDMAPAMNAAEWGLIFMMGTPPKPKDTSEVFRNRREEALNGAKDIIYVELAASDEVDPNQWDEDFIDWGEVGRANPSFPHRTAKSSIKRLRRMLSPDSFRREVLGVWDKVDQTRKPIDYARWKELEISTRLRPSGPKCFGVKFSVDGAYVALAAAAKFNEEAVLVDGLRIEPASEGIAWLVDYLTDEKRLSETAQIVIDGKSGTASLIDALRREGVKGKIILTPTTAQVIDAHALMHSGIKDGSAKHWPNPELDREVEAARWRKIGAAGGFGWAPPNDDDTVALLDAATLAMWAAKTTRRKARGGAGRRKAAVL